MPTPLAKKAPMTVPRHALAVASAMLYGRPEIYEQYRSSLTLCFDKLIELGPYRNEFQDRLSDLFPNIDNLRLYISTIKADRAKPEYYVTIKRVGGLWRIVSRRVFEVFEQVRTGVCFVPSRYVQNDPGASLRSDYRLQRVLTKGTDKDTFMADLELFETRRMLSHCAVIAGFHDFLYKWDADAQTGEIAVNTGGGRIVLKCTAPEYPYAGIWEFEALRDRKYYDTKARFQILGKVEKHGLEVKQRPRCILPFVSDAESAYPIINALPQRAANAVTALLEDRVVPIVGYRTGNWVDVFGLSYDGSTTVISRYASHKRAADVSYLPILAYQESGDLEANRVLVSCLKATLLESAPDMTPIYERFVSARYILEQSLVIAPRFDDDTSGPTLAQIEVYFRSKDLVLTPVDRAFYQTKMDRLVV